MTLNAFCRLLCCAILLNLLACGGQPTKETAPAKVANTPSTEKVADKQIPTDTLYALLVAELAINRQQHEIALNNYVQQAERTRDPEVIARATQLARLLRAFDETLNLSELWVEVEPTSLEARSIYAAALTEANRFEEIN